MVVLLHGIARSNRSMGKAEQHFAKSGYATLNIDYPSQSAPLIELAGMLERNLRAADSGRYRKLHFLTHSMGGILVRTYLREFSPANLGRVVMLAPPNQGSEVADRLSRWGLFKWFYGPAGLELQTGEAGLPAALGAATFDLGVIAGSKSLDPVSSSWLPGPDDGKVTVEGTKLDGMADHIVLPVTHTFIMRDRTVLDQAQHFLETGTFHRDGVGDG